MIQTAATEATRNRPSQITYGSGNLQLSLALRPRAVGGPSLELDGALVDRRNGGLGKVPAYLLRGSRILDESVTDERGVFKMRSGLKEGLRLCLVLGDDRMVELELGHQRRGARETWEFRPTGRSS